MSTTKGYFSLVQFCPDLSRHEAANVGVILLVPERGFIKARMAGGNDRVRRFFGVEAGGLKTVNFMKQAIANRIEVERDQFKSADDLQRFAEQQANKLVITPPRFVKVFDPDQELENLFDELVGSRSQQQLPDEIETTRQVEPVKRLLANAIRREKLEGIVQRNVTVKIPAFHTERTVPFAFQNGTLNLIQPARFNQSTPAGIRSAACQLAVEGSSLHRQPDEKLGSLKLVVVGAFRKQAHEEELIVRDILTETGVSLYSWQQIGELTEKIRKTGKAAATI